jgi:hypothetical protein
MSCGFQRNDVLRVVSYLPAHPEAQGPVPAETKFWNVRAGIWVR